MGFCTIATQIIFMKTHTLFLLIGIACFTSVKSQQNIISFSSENNTDGSVSIIGDCRGNAEYTVRIFFSILNGYQSSLGSEGTTTVYKGRREIARLTRDKSASYFQYQYKCQYFTGRGMRKIPDSSFIYLLPVTEGRSLTISGVQNIAEKIGQTPTEQLISTGFQYHLGDTICAARAGKVYEIFDGVKEGEKGTEFYKKERNKINILQKDGTLAYYSILAPVQLLVADGDDVIPGQPIAIFNKESEKYTVLFSVNYLDQKKLVADRDPSPFDPNRVSHYTFLPVLFYRDTEQKSGYLQKGMTYNAIHPKEMIATELSKKEKKKLGL